MMGVPSKTSIQGEEFVCVHERDTLNINSTCIQQYNVFLCLADERFKVCLMSRVFVSTDVYRLSVVSGMLR